jgi:GNAT superfamily N-acetyltransferase
VDDRRADVVIEQVPAERVRPLRLEVLRPGRDPDSTVFEGDDHPAVAHVAAVDPGAPGDGVVAVGTVFPDPVPWDPGRAGAWRIRGMATAEDRRGRGAGGRVLEALLAHAVAGGGTVVWCHAREGAWEFYERAGFVAHGAAFHDGLAVHRSMWRDL